MHDLCEPRRIPALRDGFNARVEVEWRVNVPASQIRLVEVIGTSESLLKQPGFFREREARQGKEFLEH
jgi:hypothetical protein